MKNAKRIFVSIALVAVMALTCLIEMAADATADDYTDILKYYDPLYSSVLIDEDFEGEGFVGDVICNANDTVANKIQVAGDENKYLSITAGGIANSAAIGDMLYYYNFDETSDLFILDFSIYASHTEGSLVKCLGTCKKSNVYYGTEVPTDATCSDCGGELSIKDSTAPVVGLYLDQAAHTESSLAGVPMFMLDFENGTVEYYAASTYLKLDIKLEEETWYKVQFSFSKNAYSVAVTDLSDDTKADATDKIGTPSVFEVGSVKVGYTAAYDNRDTEFRIDDVYLQLGDSYRDVSDAELLAITKASLQNMNRMLSSNLVDRLVKVDVIRVYDELVNKYGVLDFIASDDEAVGYANAIVGNVLSVYVDMLKEGVDVIDTSASYSNRLAIIDAYQQYADKVAEYMTESSPADAIAVYDAFIAEKETLELAETNTLAFIDLYNSIVASGRDFFSDDYTTTKSIYDEVNAEFLVDGEYTFNTTYPGAQDESNAFSIVKERYESSLLKSAAFIEAVNSIASATTDAERLSAYATASANKFVNTTYPGVADALTAFESYTDLKAIGDEAENFLAIVAQAGAALNLTSKADLLDSAEQMLESVNDNYPGIPEAKDTYHKLRQDIEDSKAAAAAYIDAVKALVGLDGDELRAAVANALLLKESGNLVEIDGVVDANIALDTAKSKIDLIDSYADKFIRLVDAIDPDATLAERHAAITLAKQAEIKADDSVSGVTQAKLELASIVIKYNDDVNAVNGAYASVASVAADFSGATVSSDGILLKVVSMIKAIFD